LTHGVSHELRNSDETPSWLHFQAFCPVLRLGSYFGDQSIEEGVFELIFASKENHDFHETIKAVLSNGLKSVQEGDEEVLNVMAKQVFITAQQDAENFLREFGEEYDRQYELALSKTH
jgi:uncharacterized membrane-anchored protein